MNAAVLSDLANQIAALEIAIGDGDREIAECTANAERAEAQYRGARASLTRAHAQQQERRRAHGEAWSAAHRETAPLPIVRLTAVLDDEPKLKTGSFAETPPPPAETPRAAAKKKGK